LKKLFHTASLVLLLSLVVIVSCKKGNIAYDYDSVFPQDKVNRIDITITAENWQALLTNMTNMYGEFGAGEGQPPENFWDNYWPTVDWNQGSPAFLECNVAFEGMTWNNVGFRFKGGDTLLSPWWFGTNKLPFKLDFDQFEEIYPETLNQRFFGLKKLSFSNGYADLTYLRRKVALDLFRDMGIPTPYAAYYRVFIDKGDGPVYFGLYTVAEYPARPLFETQLGVTGGNLYKPLAEANEVWRMETTASSFGFPKKTNELDSDWSDIQELADTLNENRANPQLWRTNLESRFDVDIFLKWLAVNNVIDNYDISGNYYIYADPSQGNRFFWIPWDVDSSFPDWDVSGVYNTFFESTMSLDMAAVTTNMLVRYILDDEVYWAKYLGFIREFNEGIFSPSSCKERFQKDHDLIAEYVVGADGELPDYGSTDATEFDLDLEDVFDFIDERNAEVAAFLASQ